MKRIYEIFSYVFCKMFGIFRHRKYLIIGGELKYTKIKNEHPGLMIKLNGSYYRITNILYDIINDTMAYEYIYLEDVVGKR